MIKLRSPRIISFLVILSIILLSLALFPTNSNNNVLEAQNSEDTLYDVIIYRDERACGQIWFVNKYNWAFTVPLEETIDKSLINRMKPDHVLLTEPSDDAYVNLTLPNGTEVKYIAYSLDLYYGFGEGSPKIWTITSTYFPRDKVLWLVIHVLVPPPANIEDYSVPSVLYFDKALILYKYINETHIGIEIRFIDAHFGVIVPFDKSYKRFNLTLSFIVNKSTWAAEYWNGEKWVPAGILPIVAPGLNPVDLIVRYSNGTLSDALKLTYLGKNYTFNAFSGEAVGEMVEFYIPPYMSLSWVKTDYEKFRECKEELLSAVIDYLLNRTTERLENIIAENHAFAKYQPQGGGYYKGYGWWAFKMYGTGSSPWVYEITELPIYGGVLGMALPVDGLLGLPEVLRKATHAFLDMGVALSEDGLEVIHNTTLPRIPSDEELGNDCYIAVAIDKRLTQECKCSESPTADENAKNIGNAKIIGSNEDSEGLTETAENNDDKEVSTIEANENKPQYTILGTSMTLIIAAIITSIVLARKH